MAINLRRPRNGCFPLSAKQQLLLPAILGTSIISTSASAVEFQLGEIEGRFDSQLSIGASWRATDRDPDLIATANGGSATSLNSGSYDDGDLNFDEGDAFTQTLKGVHDLELRYDNVGAFVRGKYWYDFELEDNEQNHGNTNDYGSGTTLSDKGFNDYAKFSGAELLDAYVFAELELNDQPLDVRVGRQVVNWGESTFVQGGINAINPIDVNAFRRPGAEIKEGLLPVNMAFASLGLTDNLTVEGFYQLEWEPTAVDGCGTYFSTNDFAPEGCNGIRLPLPLSDENYFNSTVATAALGYDPVIYRNADGRREADDDGQFGLAFRYLAEDLNYTEFGFYAMNYHSRVPVISAVNTSSTSADFTAAYVAALGGGATAQQAGVAAIGTLVDTTYFISYPEDTQLVGLSFSTNIGDIAWSGEISHRKDVPVQINGPLLVSAIVNQYSTGSGNTAADSLVSNAGTGGTISGFSQFDITQLQSTFIKFYDQVLGASRLALIGEVAWTHVHSLDEGANALKYGRPGAFGYTAGDTEGFVTQDSWGYVARANLSYSDVFAGVNLTPQISFKHGVDGYGPQPGAAFNEGEKSVSLSLTADYLNQYSVQLSYTDFFGGDFNALDDRDFVSLSATVSF